MLLKILLNKIKFNGFQNHIHQDTFARHEEILSWAEKTALQTRELEYKDLFVNSHDEIVRTGYMLREKVLNEFANKFQHQSSTRILIHLPDKSVSPGGYSLFFNLGESLKFLGIPVEFLTWHGSIERQLQLFCPTIFITSDSSVYLRRIPWQAVLDYKKANALKIGLTASLQEYGNTPLLDRLKWARGKIDFYYSFRSDEYLLTRKEYRPFFDHGYNVFSIEFGANPLLYYPVPDIDRDLNFVFLASSNPDKQERYFKYLTNIFAKYPGFIDGPGWSKNTRCADQPVHRYLYARAKIGVNLHINDSIYWPSELNERTYILAACGVPQIVDKAMLLPDRFTNDALFIADTPNEYIDQFEYMLSDPGLAHKRALKALVEVYSSHTTFHRASIFTDNLARLQ